MHKKSRKKWRKEKKKPAAHEKKYNNCQVLTKGKIIVLHLPP